MKIFINTTSWAIVKQENEYPILVGNNYVDALKVYYNANPPTQYFYPTLNILKPNDRKVGLISFDATSVEEPNPSTYTDSDNNTWYMFKFTLSSDNHQIDVSGKYQFTITTNYYNNTTGVILKQRNINTILSVVNAVTNDDNSVLILGDEPGAVVAELYALCQSLQTGVASLQISVSALQSSKADLNNPNQDIVAGSITAENAYLEDLMSEYGAQIALDSAFGGISFKPSGSNKYITIGAGQIKGIDTVSNNTDATNKQYVDTKDALKADLTNGNQTITAEQITVDKVVGKYAGSNITFDEYQNGEVIMSFASGAEPLYFSDGTIDGLSLPTSNNQATPKLYVDNKLDEKGNKIELEIDSDFKLKAKLYNGTTLLSTSTVIDLPLESVVVSGEYDATNKKVILTLEDGSTIEFSVADLISGLQSEINANNKLSSDFVDDTNNTHKFVTAEEKQQIQTNADNIASHDTALNNRYTKTETDTLLATKQDVLTGSDSVDLTGNVASVKDSYVNNFFATDAEVSGMLEEVFG